MHGDLWTVCQQCVWRQWLCTFDVAVLNAAACLRVPLCRCLPTTHCRSGALFYTLWCVRRVPIGACVRCTGRD